MPYLSNIHKDKHEVSMSYNMMQLYSELLAVSEAEEGARRSRDWREREGSDDVPSSERKATQSFRAQLLGIFVFMKSS